MDIKIYQGIVIFFAVLLLAVVVVGAINSENVKIQCHEMGGLMVNKFGRPCMVGNDTYMLEKFKWVKMK